MVPHVWVCALITEDGQRTGVRVESSGPFDNKKGTNKEKMEQLFLKKKES